MCFRIHSTATLSQTQAKSIMSRSAGSCLTAERDDKEFTELQNQPVKATHVSLMYSSMCRNATKESIFICSIYITWFFIMCSNEDLLSHWMCFMLYNLPKPSSWNIHELKIKHSGHYHQYIKKYNTHHYGYCPVKTRRIFAYMFYTCLPQKWTLHDVKTTLNNHQELSLKSS